MHIGFELMRFVKDLSEEHNFPETRIQVSDFEEIKIIVPGGKIAEGGIVDTFNNYAGHKYDIVDSSIENETLELTVMEFEDSHVQDLPKTVFRIRYKKFPKSREWKAVPCALYDEDMAQTWAEAFNLSTYEILETNVITSENQIKKQLRKHFLDNGKVSDTAKKKSWAFKDLMIY